MHGPSSRKAGYRSRAGQAGGTRPLLFNGILIDGPEFSGYDLQTVSLDSLRRLPASLVKSTHDHQGLATL
jgi:hypothetical protein